MILPGAKRLDIANWGRIQEFATGAAKQEKDKHTGHGEKTENTVLSAPPASLR